MKRFFNLLEKYLIRFIVLGIIATVLVQGLMTHEPMRMYLSWSERMEGQAINFPVNEEDSEIYTSNKPSTDEVTSPYATLTIEVQEFSSLPKAYVMINEEKNNSFASNQVRIEVMAGDIIKIDSTAYNFPITFNIIDISDNLAYPKDQQSFITNKSVVMIGKVVVK
ncbi:hypothetical protein SYNTR_1276 [Candidatus Syntrophocurvum alkaliphilum]|uniref:Uncharacterized protein n=1 Tax=Candidatus Syntrophocurvum alkaliphilum TaxID=2293317 RepID=A0A6I6DC89_9FIRM|nr:hypothetical protein [Candidatus Syntrophocurvum alkaliphilum]QGT99869.1 hypothetical protein SYNTR_1276 [Candidatus Syntrophocurvum alkaliphilum]